MKKSNLSYTGYQVRSSMLMILALLWLTVSAPFIYEASRTHISLSEQAQAPGGCDDDTPLPGNTEEKNESGSNSFSEYLHDHTHSDDLNLNLSESYNCHSMDSYLAYHPELTGPPPKA